MAAERVYEEPTDEQLASFVAVLVIGPGYERDGAEHKLVKRALQTPMVRERWLEQHRKMQEQAWALQDAAGGGRVG